MLEQVAQLVVCCAAVSRARGVDAQEGGEEDGAEGRGGGVLRGGEEREEGVGDGVEGGLAGGELAQVLLAGTRVS